MALYPITVNTPAADPAHIFAEDDAAIYEGLIGEDRVLNIGNKLNASVITNNKVRVSDGVVVVGGHVARIKKGEYEDMTIANGVSGKRRNDIVAARFMTTGSGGTDTYKLVVLQGAAGTTATDPAVVKGNLYAGDAQRDYPLWRVRIDGLSIVKVEQMYEIGMSNKDLSDTVKELNSNFESLNSRIISESIHFSGIGQNYVFIADKPGYDLAAAYNCTRQYNTVNVTHYTFSPPDKVYFVFLDAVQPAANAFDLRVVWIKRS